MTRLAASLPLALSLLLAPAASGQTLHVEEGRLGLLATPGGTVQCGDAVSISNQRIAVGLPSYSKPGRCATFTRSAGLWQLDATVDSLDGVTADLFGSAVALQGDTLVVGATNSTIMPSSPGSVYVFTRTGSTWTQQQKLVPGVPKNQGLFGAALALDGNTLVIGAPQIDPGSQGEVLVYVRNAGVWSLQQKLVPSGLFGAARLGSSVALEGDRIVIGAPTNSPDMVTPVGQAFVYERSGSVWTKTAVLDSPAGINGGKFGGAVALDGGRVAVGAPGEPQTAGQWGRVHLFGKVGPSWVFEQTLAGINGNTQNCRFGAALALEGPRLLVGAPGHSNSAASTSGTVKLFELVGSSWVEQLDVFGSSAAFTGGLGDCVALEGDWAVGGAPFEPSPFLSGAAYVWKLNPPTPSIYCTAKPSSAGCLAAMGWSGTPSASSNAPFLVSAIQVGNKKIGLLIYGGLYSANPFQGGTLCVGAPIRRTPAQSSGGSPSGNDCTGSFAFDFNAFTQGGSDPSLVTGRWVWAQYWFRDPSGTFGSGLSNALRFRIQP